MKKLATALSGRGTRSVPVAARSEERRKLPHPRGWKGGSYILEMVLCALRFIGGGEMERLRSGAGRFAGAADEDEISLAIPSKGQKAGLRRVSMGAFRDLIGIAVLSGSCSPIGILRLSDGKKDKALVFKYEMQPLARRGRVAASPRWKEGV